MVDRPGLNRAEIYQYEKSKHAEFRRAEKDGEGMALKIRLERSDFHVIPMLQINSTKWKKTN